jgi:hypothetical protein
MIDWKRSSDVLPADGEVCMLYNEGADQVIGPFRYSAQHDGWLDELAIVEHVYRSKGANAPTHWAPWNGPGEPTDASESGDVF